MKLPRVPISLPTWLLAGAVCCAALVILVAWQQQPREGEAPAEPIAVPLSLRPASRDIAQVAAAIDAELNASLNEPAFMTTPASPMLPLEEISVDDPQFQSSPSWREPELPPTFGPGTDDLVFRGPRRLVFRSGPGDAAESAVAAGLEWLAQHQQADGGWSFDHRGKTCDGNCSHPGDMAKCRAVATALALLPFLGAGQTHKAGKYKRHVENGLYFLAQQIKVTRDGDIAYGELSQKSLHAQALCTFVLSEAYGLTQDKGLQVPAQIVLNQLLREPAELDDGWRWLAIRSGRMAGLKVNANEVTQGNQLLAGALQARPGNDAAQRWQRKAVAVSLYSQMLAGWRQKEAFVERGAQSLGTWGPATGDLDYLYFASIAVRNYDMEAWKQWHEKMRTRLINAQAKSSEGHARGSWHFANDTATAAGGRLYCTALAISTLEVYYRHCPVYQGLPPQREPTTEF